MSGDTFNLSDIIPIANLSKEEDEVHSHVVPMEVGEGSAAIASPAVVPGGVPPGQLPKKVQLLLGGFVKILNPLSGPGPEFLIPKMPFPYHSMPSSTTMPFPPPAWSSKIHPLISPDSTETACLLICPSQYRSWLARVPLELPMAIISNNPDASTTEGYLNALKYAARLSSISVHGVPGNVSRNELLDFFRKFGDLVHIECEWFGMESLGDCTVSFVKKEGKIAAMAPPCRPGPEIGWPEMNWHGSESSVNCVFCSNIESGLK